MSDHNTNLVPLLPSQMLQADLHGNPASGPLNDINWEGYGISNVGFLADASLLSAVDVSNRILVNTDGTNSVRWQDRKLYDNVNLQSMDWNNRLLSDNASVTALNYMSRLLLDSSSQLAMDWQTRYLADSGSVQSIDFQNRYLKDSTATLSMDYGLRQLVGPDGTTVMLSWVQPYLDLNSHLISNMLDPVGPQDASTKNYVDTASAPISEPLSLHLDGSNSPSAPIDFGAQSLSNLSSLDVASNYHVDGLGVQTLAQAATPANPAAGFDKLYVKSDNKLYLKTSAGSEVLVGPSAGGIASINGDSTAAQVISGTSPMSASTSAGTTTVSMTAASGAASGYVTTGTQTMAGNKTFSGTVTPSAGLVGVTNGSNAASGIVGEYVASQNSGGVISPAPNNQFADLLSISLTAGDWDVSAGCNLYANNGTTSDFEFGISLVAGNDSTGLLQGVNYIIAAIPVTGTNSYSQFIAPYRVSVSTTTTVYLKVFNTFAVATPFYIGRISARRVR